MTPSKSLPMTKLNYDLIRKSILYVCGVCVPQRETHCYALIAMTIDPFPPPQNSADKIYRAQALKESKFDVCTITRFSAHVQSSTSLTASIDHSLLVVVAIVSRCVALCFVPQAKSAPKLDISKSCDDPRMVSSVNATLKGMHFYRHLQAHDGHWPGDYGGPMFLLPGMVITHHVTGTEIAPEKRFGTRNPPAHPQHLLRIRT